MLAAFPISRPAPSWMLSRNDLVNDSVDARFSMIKSCRCTLLKNCISRPAFSTLSMSCVHNAPSVLSLFGILWFDSELKSDWPSFCRFPLVGRQGSWWIALEAVEKIIPHVLLQLLALSSRKGTKEYELRGGTRHGFLPGSEREPFFLLHSKAWTAASRTAISSSTWYYFTHDYGHL